MFEACSRGIRWEQRAKIYRAEDVLQKYLTSQVKGVCEDQCRGDPGSLTSSLP